MEKREVELVVISDIHMGTYGCHAEELLRYLKTIKPKKIILNGDIIDIWQFNKRYWPQTHMQVIKYLIDMIGQGIPVHYITGNHDEMLRKFVGLELGSFKISNKLVLELDGKQAWIFHGDVFDVTMKHSKWLAKLGAIGYDILILINRLVNLILKSFGKEKISLSKKIKNGVKSAVKFINDFETTAAEIAISNSYDYVVCGHIHQPLIKKIKTDKGEVTYLNSGDWIENLTALEYDKGIWKIYNYYDDHKAMSSQITANDNVTLKSNQLFENLLTEFKLMKQ